MYTFFDLIVRKLDFGVYFWHKNYTFFNLLTSIFYSELMKMIDADINTKPQIIDIENEENMYDPEVQELKREIDRDNFSGVDSMPLRRKSKGVKGKNEGKEENIIDVELD